MTLKTDARSKAEILPHYVYTEKRTLMALLLDSAFLRNDIKSEGGMKESDTLAVRQECRFFVCLLGWIISVRLFA